MCSTHGMIGKNTVEKIALTALFGTNWNDQCDEEFNREGEHLLASFLNQRDGNHDSLAQHQDNQQENNE